MNKGLQVFVLVVLYALLSWALRDLPWSPPPLVTARSLEPLAAPWRHSPREAETAEGWLASAQTPPPAQLAAVLDVPAAALGPGPPRQMPPRSTFAGFLARLSALERGERTRVRVLQLGDSEIVADGTAGGIRSLLAARFGFGGHGFGLAMAPVPWYLRDGWMHREGRHFEVFSFVYNAMQERAYGPGMVAFRGVPGSRAEVLVQHVVAEPCVVRFFYRGGEGPGSVELLLDRAPAVTLPLAGQPEVAHHELHAARCPERLGLIVRDGPAWVYGWSVEYDRPGIVLSNVGIVAARLTHLLHYEERALVAALRAHDADLLLFTFGLNLAAVPQIPPPDYEEKIERVLRQIRAGVDAACLLTGPYPVGHPQPDGDGYSFGSASAQRVSDIQRRVAARVGCAFLDRYQLAGGAMAAARWASSRPRLLSGDHQHLTLEGSRRMGRAVGQILLAAYDSYGEGREVALGEHAAGRDFVLHEQAEPAE